MDVVVKALPFLLEGAFVTLYISALGVVVGLPIGIFILVLDVSRMPPLVAVARVYVSFFRGVPLLVHLLVFFNFLPWIQVDISPAAAAVSVLGLVSGAYVSEILRGALNSVPRGQVEAADGLGYSSSDKWRHILLPQILRLSIPALFNELTLTMKASSLISVVGLAELTRVSQNIVANTFKPMQIYATACVIYIILTQILLTVGRLLDRRLARR
jgi:polar amino acid transport system permease protein